MCEFATVELVHNPVPGDAGVSTGISHLVIQAESLDAAVAGLPANSIAAGPPVLPGGAGRAANQLGQRPGRLPDRTSS